MDVSSAKIQIALPARFSHLTYLNELIYEAVGQLAEVNADIDFESVAGDLSLAAHEICTNMIDHAYGGEGEKIINVAIQLDAVKRQIEVKLMDNGRAYNPQEMEWPPPQSWHIYQEHGDMKFILGDVPEQGIEQERGRGLYLISQLVEVVRYQPESGQNCWYLVKTY
jgi:serine/threonine-protein kinase RsbW